MIMAADKQENEILLLPDCNSLSENGSCMLMHTKNCIGRNCKFIHSSDEMAFAHARWKSRLLSLSNEKQQSISKKYYGGQMPWKQS